MKSLFILTVALLACTTSQAQNWLPENRNTKNFDDLVESYQKELDKVKPNQRDEGFVNEKIRKEGKNYHFSRWAWYWQHHLDENGNLVSPLRTLDAWKKYKQKQVFAEKFKTTANQSQWSFVGPDNSMGGYSGIGRINDIGFHPSDTNTFIVATAGGGAWRTTNGGMNWTCLTDNLPVLGMSDVDYNPHNPNTIYLCTGDRDAGDTYSMGVLKSMDGGLTWDTTGLKFKRSDLTLTNSLVINPVDTNSLTLGTSVGIMKSYDGGQSWTTVAAGHFKEVLYCPSDTNVLYAATSSPGGIWRSANGGATWQSVLTIPGTSRASIATTQANPSVVKAIFASSSNNGLFGIYHSSDVGQTFTKIYGDATDCSTNILDHDLNLTGNSCGGQGWYDLTIAISPFDANQVFVGGVNTYASSDGGFSWNIVNQWYSGLPGVATVHADKHKLAFNPANPWVLYECNDGGVYKSYSPNILWTDLSNGLQITQFYRIAGADITSFVVAGAQDNGTKFVDFTGVSGDLTGGDGMDCQIDYTDPNVFYTSTQYGNFNRTINGGSNFDNISNNIPGQPDGAWITPLLIAHFDPSTLVVGYSHVYASFDKGDSWLDISPNFSTSMNITRMSLTPQDNNRICVLQGGTLRYTKDFGGSWQALPVGFSGSISDVLIDPTDTNRVFVTYSGYGNTKVAQYIFGTGWSKLQDSLPDVPVQCIAFDTSNHTMYIGTDIGVFYRDPTMTHWVAYNNGLPATEVTDISINYATNELWASTYGRGVWRSPKQSAPSGVSQLPLALDIIKVSPNPNKGKFTITTDNKILRTASVRLRIVGYNGMVVLDREGRFDANGKMNVDAGSLAKGNYIVETVANGSVAARTKILIL